MIPSAPIVHKCFSLSSGAVVRRQRVAFEVVNQWQDYARRADVHSELSQEIRSNLRLSL
jgi:hypothetical protein